MESETIGNATLYLGDCLDLLDELQPADALISDPPYGIDLHGMSSTYRSRWKMDDCRRKSTRDKDYYLIHGDNEPFDPAPWLSHEKVILWGGIHFAQRLPDSRAWLVWDKREGTTSDNQADCEIAWSNLPGPARLHSQLWRGMMRRGEENISKASRCHPTQKPAALMMWCIEQCKLEAGSVIADPYMGSGTTGVAAVRMGHKFIGVEIERHHFDTACSRLDTEQMQRGLAL
ncbi:MAG: site-specific DNA-methyltransferase [Candidatus Thiodiazotropha lotti]|nr:site-specific DNA-methyltransferase [Candidatus Thiodiazotropha lotti]MCW4221975.1 site-specific DNA-methyltransferase [Candidatus Thiodiazotropha lotti]